MRILMLAAVAALMAAPALAQDAADAGLDLPPIVMSTEHPDEEAVDPYERSNANADAAPFEGAAMWEAFHGEAGVSRLVDDFVDRATTDPRISETFVSHDLVRLRRTLKEQFGYILGGPVTYTGRDMEAAHRDLGLQAADMGALVEILQQAMSAEGVAFPAQNRFLAKLAPMRRDIVTR
ncbi:MAG: group 1 truncated hemoglobin [Alphaproteobacteria bacterium]|nr:group 1 truncated hemoglobin [Alphaproteobacteria bacterium]MBU2378789.1 group 1 truncated hemoglobin [Alphaproteobacteria bacterium]